MHILKKMPIVIIILVLLSGCTIFDKEKTDEQKPEEAVLNVTKEEIVALYEDVNPKVEEEVEETGMVKSTITIEGTSIQIQLFSVPEGVKSVFVLVKTKDLPQQELKTNLTLMVRFAEFILPKDTDADQWALDNVKDLLGNNKQQITQDYTDKTVTLRNLKEMGMIAVEVKAK